MLYLLYEYEKKPVKLEMRSKSLFKPAGSELLSFFNHLYCSCILFVQEVIHFIYSFVCPENEAAVGNVFY